VLDQAEPSTPRPRRPRGERPQHQQRAGTSRRAGQAGAYPPSDFSFAMEPPSFSVPVRRASRRAPRLRSAISVPEDVVFHGSPQAGSGRGLWGLVMPAGVYVVKGATRFAGFPPWTEPSSRARIWQAA